MTDSGRDRVADLLARYRALTPDQQRRFCDRLGLVGAPVAVLLAHTIGVLGGLLGRGLPLLVEHANRSWRIRPRPRNLARDEAIVKLHRQGGGNLSADQIARRPGINLTRRAILSILRRARLRSQN
jgi:hypothetical protein